MRPPTYRALKWLGAWLALGASLLHLSAQVPDLPFTSGSTGADGALTFPEVPVAGGAAALAYDPLRQETLMFDAGQTWAFKEGVWRRLRPANSPSARFYAAMAFDAVRQQIVLFGGHGPGGGGDVPNDTWVWDGTDWNLKNPTTKPNGRYRPGMAFDEARGVTVMFGGSGSSETWEWDGTDWKKVTGTAPNRDWENGGICYDATRQEVLYATGSGRSVELWAFKGAGWFKKQPASTAPTLPAPRVGETGGHRSSSRFLGYDAARQQVVLFGGVFAHDSNILIEQPLEDAWIWNGEDWAKNTPSQLPPGRFWGPMTFDASINELVLFGGYSRGKNLADTWTWNGVRWRFVSGNEVEIDMAAKPDGIWNYTTIEISAGVTVRFKRNAANTPVRWLASGNVTVNGRIELNGRTVGSVRAGNVTLAGGPGGFDGGGGGVRFSASQSFGGQPGKGPGGGLPGATENAQSENGIHAEAGGYGNVFLQPLIGGSGGGGSGSSGTDDGVPGSGGGGALLISSSRDLVLNGVIQANGGNVERCCGNLGGAGSGGAVLLRADRISGTGRIEAARNLQANGNQGTQFAADGRIRLEAYYRSLPPANLVGTGSQANPPANGELNLGAGELRIVSVAGQNVPQPPAGNLDVTDVVFSEAGPVAIVLAAPGAADGTPVRVRLTHGTGITVSEPALTTAGNVTLTLAVPRGTGVLQAFTQAP